MQRKSFPPKSWAENTHTVNSVSPKSASMLKYLLYSESSAAETSECYCEEGGIDRDGEQGTSVI